MRRIPPFLFLFCSLTLPLHGCGNGGSDSGRLIEGTLTEMGENAHGRVRPKHSSGEPIEGVKICALGKCSVTDGKGQWGFLVDQEVVQSEVLFLFSGHGIETSTSVALPQGTGDVSLEFFHTESGAVEVSS